MAEREAPPLIGIDLVDPARLQARLERTNGLEGELFHPGEVGYCRRQTDPYQHLAARLAAKEAVVKALGIDGWDPLEIEVVGGDERTTVRLHGDIAKRAKALGVDVTISLTHLPVLAAAVALARPRGSAAV